MTTFTRRAGVTSTWKPALQPAHSQRLARARLLALTEIRRHGDTELESSLGAAKSREDTVAFDDRKFLQILHRPFASTLPTETTSVPLWFTFLSVPLRLRETISLRAN